MHGFGDASERGYGAVVYLRIPCGDGTHEVSLVTSRARVAPLKRVTLPRLELLGALMTARLVVFVQQALKLSEVVYRCWTDSMVALGWVQGDPSRWKPFIANRVTEIQELTSPVNWGHCAGKDNPADLVTRGLSAESLVSSKLWLEGPVWLVESSQAPRSNDEGHIEFRSNDEGHIEFHKEIEEVGNLYVANVAIEKPSLSCFEFDRWGKLVKALRVIGWVLRCVFEVM